MDSRILQQEAMISLPARANVPATEIYAKTYSFNTQLAKRDVMILIPGGPGNDHTLYTDPEHSIAEAFLPYVDTIVFDPRGCGNSEMSAVEYCSLEHYINDIEAIRQYFNVPTKQFIVFGQSYGAIAALGYAIKYHANLKKLALIGGAASSECLEQAKQNLLAIGTPEQKQLGEKIWSGSFTGEAEENEQFYQVMGPLYSHAFQPGGPTPPITYNVDVLNFGFSDFLKKFDYRQQLRQISCPTLILWGREDWLFDIKQSEILQREIQNCQLHIYKQCSHLLWIDQWQKFFHDMGSFLEN